MPYAKSSGARLAVARARCEVASVRLGTDSDWSGLCRATSLSARVGASMVAAVRTTRSKAESQRDPAFHRLPRPAGAVLDTARLSTRPAHSRQSNDRGPARRRRCPAACTPAHGQLRVGRRSAWMERARRTLRATLLHESCTRSVWPIRRGTVLHARMLGCAVERDSVPIDACAGSNQAVLLLPNGSSLRLASSPLARPLFPSPTTLRLSRTRFTRLLAMV